MKPHTISIVYAATLLLGSLKAFALEQCPAIDCDCGSLPDKSWVSICSQHETTIKQRCADNGDTPADYCLVHGENAHPLPLSLSTSDADEAKVANPRDIYENIEAMHRTVNGYLDEAKSAEKQGKYALTLERLKLIDSIVDRAFDQQKLVEASLIKQGETGKRVKLSWAKYASDDTKYALQLKEYGDELIASISEADNAKQQKIYRILAQKTYRLAGKRLEHIGYNYGKAGSHKRAAKAWQDASEVSVKLAGINREYGGKASSIKFSEFQTAARLHRASYHWLLGKAGKNATQALQESQQYVDRDGQRNIEMLVNSKSFSDQEQAISER